jgi:hypothetical protein
MEGTRLSTPALDVGRRKCRVPSVTPMADGFTVVSVLVGYARGEGGTAASAMVVQGTQDGQGVRGAGYAR